MKHVVITGSTRGIGFGLAQAFLEQGCVVTVSGRSQTGIDEAAARLAERHGAEHVNSVMCDVRQYDQLKALWSTAHSHFGRIDIWVNNAGTSGAPARTWEMQPSDAQVVIETNLSGVMYGSQAAVQGMLEQGAGAIYNMEGMGADGRKHAGLTAYGTSKYAVCYYTACLVEELKSTPLVIGALRPGMVATELVTDPYRERPEEWKRVRRIFNVIAERVDIVCPWLAQQMLANTKSGVHLNYMSTGKLLRNMILAGLGKRELFNEDST